MALTQISTQGIKDGTITGTDLATNVDLVDNQKLRLGTGTDFSIFHNGTNNVLSTDNGQVQIVKGASENIAIFIPDGAVELYHNNTKRFETSSSGVTVSGDNSTGSILKGVTRFTPNDSTTVKVMWDETGFSGAGHFQVKDGVAFTAGNSSDLKIYH